MGMANEADVDCTTGYCATIDDKALETISFT
jgi:hypothetical protein